MTMMTTMMMTMMMTTTTMMSKYLYEITFYFEINIERAAAGITKSVLFQFCNNKQRNQQGI